MAGSLLLRRFGLVARTEGLGAALGRSRRYIRRRIAPLLPQSDRRVKVRSEAGYLQPVWQDLAQRQAFNVTQAPALLRRRRQIALIGDLNLPQCRKYRVEQLAEFWRSRGVGCEYAHYADIPRATGILQLATHLCEYRLPQTEVTQMLRYEARRLRLPILYDIDDPLFSMPAYAAYSNMAQLDPDLRQGFLMAAPGYLNMMAGADAVSLSTPGLIREAEKFVTRPLFLRRNFADSETLEMGRRAIAARSPDGLFRFAFSSGSQGHEADLAPILYDLSRVILAAPDRRLMILGHFRKDRLPAELRGRVELLPFTDYGSYLRHLARADCALVPLTDDPFNQCKSAVRVLDAAAVEVPAVVSTVGDLPQAVRQNRTGWVQEGPDSWAACLAKRADDPLATRAAGRRARRELIARTPMAGDAELVSPELLEWIEG